MGLVTPSLVGSGTHPRPPRSYREERPRVRSAPRQYTASAAFQRTSPRFLWEPAFLCQPRAPRPSERIRGLASPASDSAAVGCLQLIKPDPQMAQPSGTLPHLGCLQSAPTPAPHTNNTGSTLPQQDPGCPSLARQEPVPARVRDLDGPGAPAPLWASVSPSGTDTTAF